MRVLVTGAGGFIGAHAVRGLLSAGHDVIALDRPEASLDRIATILDTVEVARIELGDQPRVAELLRQSRPDAILHLAWYADPRDYLVGAANLGSLAVTTRLVEAALAAGCRKLVLTGSC